MGDIGGQALTFAWILSLLGAGAGAAAGIAKRDDWCRVAERSLYVVLAALTVAMLALFYALATGDFSLRAYAS